MTLAEYLVQFLRRAGVGHVFGLPGGENVAVIEALRQAGVDYVLVHHEATAGYAAMVSGELTGRPGVCMATVGPGAANLVAATAAATLERSPMLAITADIDSREKARISHMNLDLAALFGPVCKGSFSLRPETAGETLVEAWRMALDPPRGAVHLIIPPDLAQIPVTGQPAPKSLETGAVKEPPDLSTLRPLLASARAPFIVAGLGMMAASVEAELLTLAERWHVPVTVTPKAKGHFPDSHPLYAGCLTAYGDGSLRRALDEADLILGVGLDGVDLVTSTWQVDTPTINLSRAASADPVIKPAVAIDGDLRSILRALADEKQDFIRSLDGGVDRAAALRDAIARDLIAPTISLSPGTIALTDLIAALRSALPAGGAVTVDVGAFKLVFLQSWQADMPKSLFVANGLSAMGYAVPGGLAIKLTQPERPVVAIPGDGALLMYAGELATVARLNLPLVILVVVDEALALIRLKQERGHVPVHGTEFGRTDYASLAAAFGLAYRLIDGPAEAQSTLAEALAQPGPVLVEARIDKAEYGRFR